MDVLTSMSIFCRVVEAGSFSAIARESGASQSTISKHIAALELRLETKLLNRSTRQLNLTEAGQEYYNHCLRILGDVDESEASVGKGKSLPSGTIRITTPVMFGRLFIAPMLWEFQMMYSDVKIDMVMDDSHIDLVKEGLDVAIRAGKLSDSSLVARKIGICPKQVLVASPLYLEKFGEPKSPADLQHHRCLLHSLLTPANNWEFSGPTGEETVQVNSHFISNNRDTINAAALAGIGIGTVFLWPNANNIKQGRLKVILSDYTLTELDIFAVYPQRRYVPQKVRRLIDFISQCFAANDKFRSMVENTTQL